MCTAGCQWDFRRCGEGFILDSVHSSGSCITVPDLKGLYWGGSAQALASAFPTCWDVEILTLGANDAEPGDVFARYVWIIDLEGHGLVLLHEDTD